MSTIENSVVTTIGTLHLQIIKAHDEIAVLKRENAMLRAAMPKPSDNPAPQQLAPASAPANAA